MGYRYHVSIQSTHKYAVRANGDLGRVVDLPDGGVAMLVIDGQGSGPSARLVARGVADRLTGLLHAGCTAEIAARAANQALFAERGGQVSVSFDVVRAGTDGAFELAGYSTNSVFVSNGEAWAEVAREVTPAGRSGSAAPAVHHFPANLASQVVIATDGVGKAGGTLEAILMHDKACLPPGDVALLIFENVLEFYDSRPKDDLTVAQLSRSEIPANQRTDVLEYSRDVR